MALTTAQIATLAADIQTHPELDQYWQGAANDNVAIRDYYNAADPTLADCWRTSFSLAQAHAVTNWTEFIGRSQGERDAYRFMFMVGPVNPADPNIRGGFTDIFSGPSGAITRAALAAAAKRKMTRAERRFATDTGQSTFTLSFEGLVTSVEAHEAMLLIPGA